MVQDETNGTDGHPGLKPSETIRNHPALDLDCSEGHLKRSKIDSSVVNTFKDFPISTKTLKGLEEFGFTKPTDIQRDGIALALRGLDMLGAAKTGSGKTLAFLIPVLELLWKEKWSNTDGLGALVISPTRELAIQTYEVLRKVGKYHDFSAGLIIGGKDIESEKGRILNTNIIICTPGRLLQHFDETPNFQCLDLKILVLDEADRILDLGFAASMNAIIENLPDERQTLLFSATQTKSVKDLARLSLQNPEYVAVHENSKYTTPKKLVQNFAVIELQHKINFLFSFIKNHLKSKSIVFLSSCKQVKFLYEVFRKIRPGIPLMALYGKQKQLKRVGIYNRFRLTQHAVLFATDIAARGLDFPAVNWVVQFDCPENVDTYIHRVGRTARYEKGGQALLMILPSELALVTQLEERKIPIHEIKANPKKMRLIEGKLQAFCAQDQEIKHWAQRSIVSYARSVHLQSDKSIFDVNKLPLDAFAVSCGLLAPPKIRFMKKLEKRIGQIGSPKSESLSRASEKKLNIELLDKTLKKKLACDAKAGDEEQSDDKFHLTDDSDDDEDDVLVKKTKNLHHMNLPTYDIQEDQPQKKKTVSKTSLAKKVIRKNIKMNTKIKFDEDDQAIMENEEEEEDDERLPEGGINVEEAKLHMKAQDKIDREKERKRIKEKHREIKRKEREERQADAMEQGAVLLAPSEETSDNENLSEDVESGGGEDESIEPPRKKKRSKTKLVEESKSSHDSSLFEDEELALHLLAGNI